MRTNTLIHADHHTPVSILVIKRPDSFSWDGCVYQSNRPCMVA